MEKKVRTKIDEYILGFKQNIKDIIDKNEYTILNKQGADVTNTTIEMIYDFKQLDLTKDDFQKSKRTKNVIPNFERCCALRLN